MFEFIKKTDWLLTITITVLLMVGTSIVYSTTLGENSLDVAETLMPKQLLLIIFGFSIYLFISKIEFSWFKESSLLQIYYLLILIMLIYVLAFAPTIAGTNRWIDLGFIAIQPAEFAKLAIILFMSYIFSRRMFFEDYDLPKLFDKIPYPQFWLKAGFSLLLLIPLVTLTFLQPALGNTIIMLLLWGFMIFFLYPDPKSAVSFLLLVTLMVIIGSLLIEADLDASGNIEIGLRIGWSTIVISFILASISCLIVYINKLPYKLLIIIPILITIALSLVFFSWNNLLSDYQQTRVTAFVSGPKSDPQGSGYQVNQSMIAIGSGRLYGRGFLSGTQSSLQILTQANTDFAFAAFSEQFGFIGAIFILSLFAILLSRIYLTGISSKSPLARIVCLGILTLFIIHIFINIGMNLGLMPVTGIPLPFISYGGSSTLLFLAGLGIVQSINTSKKPVDMSNSLMLRSLESIH